MLRRARDGHLAMAAAAVAFYAVLAFFPALALAVSLYGLAADPADAARHFGVLGEILPAAAIEVLAQQVGAVRHFGTGTGSPTCCS